MDIKRFALFLALAAVIFTLNVKWQAYQLAQNPAPVAQSQTADGSVPTVTNAAAPNIEANTAAKTTGKQVQVTTDLLDIKVSTLGGSISYAGLIKHPTAPETPDQPFVLLMDTVEQSYTAQSGLAGGDNLPNHTTEFSTTSTDVVLAEGQDQADVVLTWKSPEGVNYTKTLRFYRDSYRVDVIFDVDNQSGQTWNGNFYGQLQRTIPSTEGKKNLLSGKLPSYTGGAYYTETEHYTKVDFGDIDDGALKIDTDNGWVAMLQHYFVSAWMPEEGRGHQFFSGKSNAENPSYRIGYIDSQATSVVSGSTGQLKSSVFIGPKEQARLEAQPVNKLVLTVDYGFFTLIASPIFWVLDKIHSFVGNWGWSILLITLLLKALFYPLSAASYKSMARMKKLSPRLKTLKERYGDDRQRFQKEMMALYKKEKVNPAGGCLPMLVQMPVFLGLYWVLVESVEMRQTPWAFWISDLSAPDPLHILPVVMGVSMLAQQFLNPATMDKMQKNIMMALPVIFTIFFLGFPAGLVLYWVFNNLLSIAQQWFVSRKYS